VGTAELPLALALVAGAVAAVNPCGFALLPAYLAMLVSDAPADGVQGTRGQVLRAARFSLAMTAGFVAVFGVFGAVIARLSLSVERYLPVVTLAIGVVLVVLGVWVLRGGHVPGIRLAGRVGLAPRSTLGSQVLYGVAFAAASLSCTIAPFLAVTGAASRTADTGGVLLTFVVYALGMGSVVTALAMAVALAQGSLVHRLRSASPVIERVSGLLLVLAGAYIACYAWFEIRVLSGRSTGDPVVDAAGRLQTELSRAVAGLGVVGLTVLAVAAVAVVTGLALTGRRKATARR
jgi:cytochrome c biogenesis protein CcdA